MSLHQAVSQGAGHSHRSGGKHKRGRAGAPVSTLHAKDLRKEATLCEGTDTTGWDHWEFMFENFSVGKRCRKCLRLTRD